MAAAPRLDTGLMGECRIWLSRATLDTSHKITSANPADDAFKSALVGRKRRLNGVGHAARETDRFLSLP